MILIFVGVAETVALAMAFALGFTFAGGSLVYVYAGYRLLKRDNRVYRNVTSVLTLFIVFLVVLTLLIVVVAIQVLIGDGISAKISPPVVPTLLTISYGVGIATLATLLFHPETRRDLNLERAGQNPWMLYLSRKRITGVLISGGLLAGLTLGPHVLSNPMQTIANAIRQDRQVQETLGSVERIFLLKTGTFNWTVKAQVEVAGTSNTGFYYAELPPGGPVRLDAYDFAKMPDMAPASITPPAVDEFEAPGSNAGNEVLLLSTSFEGAAEGQEDELLPLIQDRKIPWRRQGTAHSGRYAINAIPEGNPGVLRYFAEPVSGVQLSSRLSGEYSAFDVTELDVVTLEFWRFSTSNPSETHNCLGSLRVDYKLDAAEWESRMVYCGRHKSRARKWTHEELSFDTTDAETLEIRFEYEYPPSSQKDRTAMYLIDDLQIRGFRNAEPP